MWHEDDMCHDIQHHNQPEGCSVCTQVVVILGELCLLYHYQQNDLYCWNRHNSGPSVFSAVPLRKASGGRAFEGMAMYFEVNGQALVEVGKTTEMVAGLYGNNECVRLVREYLENIVSNDEKELPQQ